ncbi:MAG: methionyl-tRNA formyltransferase [Bdellovibrionales bacterium]|nr:methionyl-tRNA formyltransferase [Bdellovibrionales bacterium]
MKRARVVFFGTPEFAVPSLHELVAREEIDVLAVVTQPDRPSGRGQRLSAPPVAVAAKSADIPLFQPLSVKHITLLPSGRLQGEKSAGVLVDFLNQHAPIDAFICVAYGKIIPESLLQFARVGMLNIHPSLLPRWRGAAPLQYTIFSGDTRTGVSLMQITPELDAGPVYAVEEVAVPETRTLGELHDELASVGAKMLVQHLPAILDGTCKAAPQPEEGVTYAEKWEKEDARIRWEDPAEVTVRRIRASNPVPGARMMIEGEPVKVFQARVCADQNFPPSPSGTIVEVNRRELIVACGTSQYIAIEELQFPGKKRLATPQALKGHPLAVGLQLL